MGKIYISNQLEFERWNKKELEENVFKYIEYKNNCLEISSIDEKIGKCSKIIFYNVFKFDIDNQHINSDSFDIIKELKFICIKKNHINITFILKNNVKICIDCQKIIIIN